MLRVKSAKSPFRRTALFVTGVAVVLISPVIGAIPGPGGVFVFAAGLALILQNSYGAKKQFARIARRWPKIGYYADIGLRRPSAARRRARDRTLTSPGDEGMRTASRPSKWRLFSIQNTPDP